MKFRAKKTILLQCLNIVIKAIGSWSTLPILSNVLIEAKWGKVYLTATDLEVTISNDIEAEVYESWAITISGKILQPYLALLTDGDIDFVVNGIDVVISTKTSKTAFKWVTADDYPKVVDVIEWNKYTLISSDLQEAISRVIFCVSNQPQRPVLKWVLFETNSGEASLLTTDSFRMSFAKFPCLWDSADTSVILPGHSLLELSRIISEFEAISSDKYNIDVIVSWNQILFKIWTIKMISRFIEWFFPKVKTLIPASSSVQVSLERDAFIQVVRRLIIFAKEDNYKMHLRFSSSELYITTNLTQIWSDETTIVCSTKWEDLSITLNGQFLLEALSAIRSKEIIIESNWPSTPFVFKLPGSDKFVHIIMPLKN